MKKFILLILLFSQACSYYPNSNGLAILDANTSAVKNCKLLGQVYGESKFAYLALGSDIAKDRAKNQAASIGATHIHWVETSARGFPYALGKAYRCG